MTEGIRKTINIDMERGETATRSEGVRIQSTVILNSMNLYGGINHTGEVAS